MDQIGGMLEQYAAGGTVDNQQARNDYDKIASAVPTNVLGSVIGPALASLGGQQVEERVRNSASEMAPDVRGQFMQALLNAAGSKGANVSAILSQFGVNQGVSAQPASASPDDVAKVAARLHQSHPDAFNQAMTFYTQHPTLVKVLGTMAIAKIAQHLSGSPQAAR